MVWRFFLGYWWYCLLLLVMFYVIFEEFVLSVYLRAIGVVGLAVGFGCFGFRDLWDC